MIGIGVPGWRRSVPARWPRASGGQECGGLADAGAERDGGGRPHSPARGFPAQGERGAAVIEFVLVFVVLVVPLVYAIVVMADVQRALLAVSTAAREVARVYVTASSAEEAKRRTALAYEEVMENFGYTAGDPRAALVVRAECATRASGCLGGMGPGTEVMVRITYRVPVARLPFIGAIAGPDLPVGATHHTRVDRYRPTGP